MPKLIIMLGPTGAGKTRSLEKVQEMLGLKKDLVKLSLDDCVVNSQEYKNHFDSLIYRGNLNKEEIYEKFSTPSDYYYKKIKNKYFEIRRSKCDSQFDKDLTNNIKKMKDISLEVTSGEGFIEWMYSLHPNAKKYEIYMIWTTASLNNLIERNISRYQKGLKCYLNGTRDFPPRLTFRNETDYIKNLRKIIRSMNSSIDSSIQKTRVLVIKNNTIPKIVYDNHKDKTCEECANIFKLKTR